MNILAVDTSSPHPSAVISRDGRVMAEISDGRNLGYSEHLFGTLARLLETSGIGLDEIDAFVAARGPGSFTGIRVGMAAIDAFAFARSKPAYGVSALAAIAWQHVPGEVSVVPLLEAGHGRFYGAVYRRENQSLVLVKEPEVRDAAGWLDAVGGPARFSGAGAEKLEDTIVRYGRPESEKAVVRVSPVLAPAMVEIVESGQGEPLAPLYLLRTSAEENLRRRNAASGKPRCQGADEPEKVSR